MHFAFFGNLLKPKQFLWIEASRTNVGSEGLRLKMKAIIVKSAGRGALSFRQERGEETFGCRREEGKGEGEDESKHSKLKEHSTNRERDMEKRELFQR